MEGVLLTIGEVAARLGVPVRTVRFWSDAGLVDPPARSAGGYRLYDAAAVARLDLVRTLRGLGLGLPAVRELLAARRAVADVAAEHVRALDAEIRLLRLRRTLLQAVVHAGTPTEEMRIVSDLAALSARERQRIVDDFVDRAFAGLPDDAPGAGLAAPMRSLPAELPEEPTAEQVAAWLELARLVADDGFAARVREMAVAGAGAGPEDPDPGVDAGRLQTLGRRALADGVPPGSPAAEALVAELLDDGREDDPGRRAALADRLAAFTDARVERYWQLLGVLNGRPPFEPSVPAVAWWVAALRAAP
ncbi:DNA-binding transcriptional regulator, MerR family [Geodermatophilus dictyosporus]|uniref:DNA-binding transcriptional regulator, MerR family n=1 Tax=Geodermatophilus dictyosporus TaxID=1523247 RepID=A0A1I5Q2M3_9ACTN|nr:MerR family transcriptional regulator [Geodermatophilus dictyosporus]SFP40614.1 DNA-binding transcriptional regulator, MerR family [Geodermatophilus dictyosporus]